MLRNLPSSAFIATLAAVCAPALGWAANATLTVDAGAAITTLAPHAVGMNVDLWDDNLGDAGNAAKFQAAGLALWRYPGGSTGDQYHWQVNRRFFDPPNQTFRNDLGTVVGLANQAGAKPLVTVNYGTGTPEEAAAWVKSAKDNHYGITYWEIGNEMYGGGYYPDWHWEPNDNADKSPRFYGQRCREFITQMKAADPSIKIGVVVTMPFNENNQDGKNGFQSWNPEVLGACGDLIDFVSPHWYPFSPGSEGDDLLLYDKVGGIASMAETMRSQINAFCGANAAHVKIIVSETNSAHNEATKQTIGIVNGIFAAVDYLEFYKHGAESVVWWGLREDPNTSTNRPDLFGDASYGSLGLLSYGRGPEPAVNTPYSTYFGVAMMTRMAKAGDTLVAATSSDAKVLGYAARQANGDLAVLLANRDRDQDVPMDIHIAGFSPAGTASVSTYGKSNLGGIVSVSRNGIANTFTVTAGAYSLTTIVMTPAGSTPPATPPPATPPPTTPPPTPPSATETPFTTAIAIPGVIEAEAYDRGGEGVAYHDTTAGNSGNALRADDVDVEDGGTGVTDVGWTATGEWLKYTVTVATSGPYSFAWRVASMDDQAVLHLEDGHGVQLGAVVRIPATGAWQTYATVTTTATLTAGVQVLKLVVDHATLGGNIDRITVTAAGAGAPPPSAPVAGASAGGGGKSGCGLGSGLAALLMCLGLVLRACVAGRCHSGRGAAATARTG